MISGTLAVFTQKPDQERLRGLGTTVTLQKNIEHEPVLVHGSPSPVSNAIDARIHLVERPPGTPSDFPVAQVLSEEGSELDTPFAQGLVTDLNDALLEQFLQVPVTQWKTVVEPDGMLDDGHGKAVAVRLGVGHGGLAYPDPVKATQPLKLMHHVRRDSRETSIPCSNNSSSTSR